MADKKKGQKETAGQDSIALPVEWHFPEDQASFFANHIVVQRDEHEYHISFFDVRPPLVMGNVDQKREQLKKLKTVRANCVARIVVSAARLPGFIQALENGLRMEEGPKAVEDHNKNGDE